MILRRAGNGGVVTSFLGQLFFSSFSSARSVEIMVQLAFFTRHYCRAICKTIFRDNLQLEFIVTIFKKIVKPREVIVMEYKEKVKRRESFIIAHFILLRIELR